MSRLMTHVVVGYPDLSATQKLIQAMIDRQVAAIELQIPFSDPIADGPVLMHANDMAVANGTSVKETLGLIASSSGGDVRLYIMSYLQPIIHYGPKPFFQKALSAGCQGFIIPDLPFDAPETRAFIADQSELRSAIVPVLSPGMKEDRLAVLFETLKPNLIYVTARHGITGDRTDFSDNLEKMVKRIKRYSTAKLAIGFGIQNTADVQAVLKVADLAVVGSVLASALGRSEGEALALLESLSLAVAE